MTELNIESLEKLHLEPGDYLIAKLSEYYPTNVYQRIRYQLEKTFQKDIEEKGLKIIVLEPGLELARLNVIEKKC